MERLAGQDVTIDTSVGRETCRACCGTTTGLPGTINGALAALLYEKTSWRLANSPASESERAYAEMLKAYALRHLDQAVRGQDHLIRQSEAYSSGYSAERTTVDPSVSRGGFPFSARPRIGLVGWNTRTGLGYQNRDIATHLRVSKWLAPDHPEFSRLTIPSFLSWRTTELELEARQRDVRAWLAGLDWVLFVESPLIQPLTSLAKRLGVRVACICNWEWICPVNSEWLCDVDLMICPTRHSLHLMNQLRARYGYSWRTVYVPWPISTRRFRFRLRRKCRRFVFVNGNGGVRGRCLDGSHTPYHRKGVEVLCEAARRIPHIPITIFSQSQDIPAVPDNVRLCSAPADNRSLYQHGDVCIQPSHWEGLGLQLLECQAAGMPLVTTDAAPMNEHNPHRTIPVSRTDIVFLQGYQPVPAQIIDPDTLAGEMRRLFNEDLRQASLRARRFVRRHHGWRRAKQVLRLALNQCAAT